LWKATYDSDCVLEKCKTYPPGMWKRSNKPTELAEMWKSYPHFLWNNEFRRYLIEFCGKLIPQECGNIDFLA